MAYKKSSSPKKKTKGPRIALHLPRDVQGLYTRAVAIWAAIKDDQVHFATPYPPAAEVEADLAELGAALQAAEGGDPSAVAALHVAAGKVRQTFELLGKYVQSVVRAGPVEDAPAVISNVLMFESKVGTRAPKPELEVRDGATTGVALVVARALVSTMAYFWEYSPDQQTWTAGPLTAQAHSSFAGLTPGNVYYFRFRAFQRDGTMTNYSQVVSFMAK